VQIISVPNEFFGGNICLGDLLVVEDFARLIERELGRRPRPDLIVVPSSPFSRWGRDLRGHSRMELVRRFGVQFVFAENNRVLM
jgi:hypothetical protein